MCIIVSEFHNYTQNIYLDRGRLCMEVFKGALCFRKMSARLHGRESKHYKQVCKSVKTYYYCCYYHY